MLLLTDRGGGGGLEREERGRAGGAVEAVVQFDSTAVIPGDD